MHVATVGFRPFRTDDDGKLRNNPAHAVPPRLWQAPSPAPRKPKIKTRLVIRRSVLLQLRLIDPNVLAAAVLSCCVLGYCGVNLRAPICLEGCSSKTDSELEHISFGSMGIFEDETKISMSHGI